jgi:hypothetical protein
LKKLVNAVTFAYLDLIQMEEKRHVHELQDIARDWKDDLVRRRQVRDSARDSSATSATDDVEGKIMEEVYAQMLKTIHLKKIELPRVRLLEEARVE